MDHEELYGKTYKHFKDKVRTLKEVCKQLQPASANVQDLNPKEVVVENLPSPIWPGSPGNGQRGRTGFGTNLTSWRPTLEGRASAYLQASSPHREERSQ